MLGRYRQPLPMSVLLIVSDADGESLAASPLARSLTDQRDAAWTFGPTDAEVLATVRVASDTLLRPGALEALRAAFAEHPDIEAVLGDAIVGGARTLRPGWSPTTTAGAPAELDLVATRGSGSGGTLADRIAVLGHLPVATVGHLPVALVERPAPETVDDAAQHAIADLVAARRRLPQPTAATFLIPTAGTRRVDGTRLVDHAIAAARGAGVDEIEILLVVGDEFDGDPAALAADDVRIVRRDGPWSFSAAVNAGLLEAHHDHLVLVNDDVEMIDEGWAAPLLGHLRDPDVSLVGAALLYPDHRVQHIGIVIDDALPLHAHVGTRLGELRSPLRLPREVAAVTAACAAGRRRDLLAVGGLSEALPANFNDVDLCFKLQREIGRIVIDPTTPLVHHESASRVPVIEAWEWETFVGRWGEVVDPWYHPGHHRPDDPHDRRRNADRLPPDEPDGRWALRTPTIRPTVHRARLEAPTADRPHG